MFNGGYLMVSKTDTDLYKKLNNALNLGKPILFYEDATTCYYIDTIALSGDDVVLTKGGKTITITDANVVTESGDIQVHLYVITFTAGDYRVSMFAKKKLDDYAIDDMSDLSATDIEYFKALKDVLYDNNATPVGALYGADTTATDLKYLSGVYGSSLFLNLDNMEYEVNLNNPTSQALGSNLSISFTTLI